MNITDVVIATMQLLENIGAMAIVILLFLHRFPLTVYRPSHGINFAGLLLFSLLALISIIPILETKDFTANLSMVAIILAAVHVGVVEAILVALLTAIGCLTFGSANWIPWAVGTPIFCLITVCMLKLFNNLLTGWKLGLITLINCLCLLAYLSAFSTAANTGISFWAFSEPKLWYHFFIPITFGTVAGTMLLHWLIGYLQNHRSFTKLLVEAEIKYRSLVESSHVGIYVVQGTQLVYVNRGFAAITGFSRSELLGLANIFDYIHPDDRAIVHENIQKKLTGQQENLSYELRLQHAGTFRYVEVHGSYFEMNGNPSVIGTMIDITERKQAEIELRQSEARLRGIIAAIPDMVTVIDKNGLVREMLSHNEAIPQLTGAMGTGKNICNILCQPLAQQLLQHIQKALHLQNVQTFEYQDEHTWILEVQLSAINNQEVVSIIRDITTRKQNEENYRLSMERYQSLFNSSHDAILVYPASMREGGTFLEVNDQSCKSLGYSREELLTMSFYDIAEPIPPEVADKHQQELLTSGHSLLEATHITKEGKRFPVEVNSHLFKLWDAPIIISVARDVSERKQVEKALRESEERFRYLADHIPLMVWMDDATGQCIFVNKQWQEYTGLTLEEGKNTAWDKYIHPRDQKTSKNILKKAVNRREELSYEHRMLHHNGEYRWVQSIGIPRYDLNGTFVGYIGCCFDIHDKRVADRDLKQSYRRLEKSIEEQTRQLANANATLAQEVFVRRAVEKRYRQLFDSVQDSIFVWKITPQGLPGRIIEVNDIACRRLGYTRDDLLSLSMLDTMSAQGKSTASTHMEKLLTSRQAIIEFDHLTKDGISIPSEVNAHLFALNGELVGLCISRDISDRKQAESELLAARNRINRTEKLAFLGNMAAGIAHEINQPLNSIKVTADSILMWSKEGQAYHWEEFLEDVQTISDQSARIANIIKYIRDLIRTNQQSNNQRFSITSAITNAIKMTLSQQSAADITLTLKLTDNPLEIYGSLAHMEHVLLNLINNSLEVLANLEQPLKEIEIETRLEDKIVVQISDNGTGISETIRKNIFTPFFTTKSNGMGLGLVIVKSVVTSHGGQINITNNDRGGATFRLEFPIIEADNAKEDNAS